MIKYKRKSLGLTQQTAAVLVGVNAWTVINWENGHNAPSDRLYPSLIRVFGCDPGPEPRSNAKRLRAARLRRELSRAQIAALLEVDEGSIAVWGTGRGPHHCQAMAKVETFVNGRQHPRRMSRQRP